MAYYEGTAEWFEKISKIKSKNERVRLLREGRTEQRKQIVDICFNPRVEWLLPEGPLPEEFVKFANKNEDLQNMLVVNMRKFRIFLRVGEYDNISKSHRENAFIEFLESIDPDDAKLVMSIKERKIPYPYMTQKLFEEAWPDMVQLWAK